MTQILKKNPVSCSVFSANWLRSCCCRATSCSVVSQFLLLNMYTKRRDRKGRKRTSSTARAWCPSTQRYGRWRKNTPSNVPMGWVRLKRKTCSNVRVNTETMLRVNHCCSSAFDDVRGKQHLTDATSANAGELNPRFTFQPAHLVHAFDLIYYSVVMQLCCQAESSTYAPKIRDCNRTLCRQSLLGKIWKYECFISYFSREN